MRATYATKPREQVSSILRHERRYLSASEIHKLLRKAHAKVSLATIYRTLDLLASKGEANARTDDGAETKYVYCEPTHHHHAICGTCGKVQDVSCEAVETISTALRAHHGFELADHEMEFVGRCSACR
ncbi:MAG TPA: transcriptional repressor [Candidatus Rubrimentiphilum sp.]|nr:transcriptional repressor [Candidatus Rubrimentiphilum sp.]